MTIAIPTRSSLPIPKTFFLSIFSLQPFLIVHTISRAFVRLIFRWLVLVFVLLVALTDQAGALKMSEIGDRYVDLAPYVSIIRDETGTLKIDELKTDPSRFSPLETRYIDMRQTKGAYWVRVALNNDTFANRTWRFEIRRPYLLELSGFVVSDGETRTVVDLEENAPQSERPVNSRYFGFDVALQAQSEAVLYVRYRSFATGFLPLFVSDPQSSRNIRHTEEHINWLFNGMVVIMIFFVILLGRIVGWAISLSFASYSLFGGLFIFHADGYSALYIWPNWAAPSDHINMLLALAMTFSALMFARNLFDTKTSQAGLDRYYRALAIILPVLFLVSFVGYGTRWFNPIPYVTIFLVSLLHPLIGLVALSQKKDGAVPFLFGTPFILGSLIYSAIAHLFHGRFSVEVTLNIGHLTLVIESLAFAIAILLRVLGVQKQRDRALHSELVATTERARLAAELYETEKRYAETKLLAAQHGERLATYGHDILQPLIGLRSAMENAAGLNNTSLRQVAQSFDYLETLANEQIETNVSDEQREDGAETFALNSVLDASVAMFSNEAIKKGIELQYRSSFDEVTTNPVALMRMINNLISNALKHAEDGIVEIGSFQSEGQECIFVKNLTSATTEEDLSKMIADGQKRPGSPGFGLGLGIVTKLADELGIDFTLDTNPGEWTQATLKLPISKKT